MTDRTGRADGPVRALHVLETLAGMRQPASLLAVASALDQPKVKAYRALRALQDEGYVDHVGRDGYRVGGRSLALATLLRPRPELVRCARSTLARLARDTGRTALLQLRSGAHRVCVLGVPADTGTRSPMQPGERAPLASGCSGLVILAHLDDADAGPIVAGRPWRQRRADRRALERIRADGYAVSKCHNHTELNGVAAPLIDAEAGAPIGSLALVGDPADFGTAAMRRAAGPLLRASGELAPALARFLGPHASTRQASVDVAVQELNGP